MPLAIGFYALLAILTLWFKSKLWDHASFGVVLYALFFFTGMFCYQLQLPQNDNNHYFKVSEIQHEPQNLQLKITEILKEDSYYNKYIGELQYLNDEVKNGALLVAIRKDSVNSILEIDTQLAIKTSLLEISSPLNPDQFNYKKYLEHLGIYHQIQISPSEILKIEKGKTTLRGIAEKFRQELITKLAKTPISPKEQAIIRALVLGEKRNIDKEQYAAYAAAGAVHILAVSGLHVGIIFFILKFICFPFRKKYYGKVITSIIILTGLWSYAFITGLSPSVTRAVTMFSFFAFATLLNRKTSSINTLALSFLVLLVYHPNFIFHVGFQMSYLAVLAIIIIQPKLYSYYLPRNYFKRKTWGIITVTFAAQVGVVPLSLYYFHQFPGLFFITNLVILPFLGILLGLGIGVLGLLYVNMLPDWAALGYGTIVKALNQFIDWVAAQSTFIVSDVYFPLSYMMVCYLFVITAIIYWYSKKHPFLISSFLLIFLLVGIKFWEKYDTQDNLIVFHKTRHSIIGYKHLNSLKIFTSDTTHNYNTSFPIQSYVVANNVNKVTPYSLKNIIVYSQHKILVIDSLVVFTKMHTQPTIVLIQSPKINLNRLVDSLHPKMIIADGSNYKSYVQRWKKTCEHKKIPFHSTFEKGAYIFK